MMSNLLKKIKYIPIVIFINPWFYGDTIFNFISNANPSFCFSFKMEGHKQMCFVLMRKWIFFPFISQIIGVWVSLIVTGDSQDLAPSTGVLLSTHTNPIWLRLSPHGHEERILYSRLQENCGILEKRVSIDMHIVLIFCWLVCLFFAFLFCSGLTWQFTIMSSVEQGSESSDFILISDFSCSSQNPIFRLLMKLKSTSFQAFQIISDFFSHICSHTAW